MVLREKQASERKWERDNRELSSFPVNINGGVIACTVRTSTGTGVDASEQTALDAHLKCKQLLLLAFARQRSGQCKDKQQ